MRRFFKRMALALVLYMAKRRYSKAVRIAEDNHKKRKTTWYVVLSPTDNLRLVVLDRKNYRKIRIRNSLSMHDREKYGMDSLKRGCFYHTADAGGGRKLSPMETEARRMAYLRHSVLIAGLGAFLRRQ